MALALSARSPSTTHLCCYATVWPQAAGALKLYGVHAVVANELLTRKDRVLLVTQEGCPWVGAATPADGKGPAVSVQQGAGIPVRVEVVDRPVSEAIIEPCLVSRVVAMHTAFRRQ